MQFRIKGIYSSFILCYNKLKVKGGVIPWEPKRGGRIQKKATVYDLQKLFEKEPGKTYTVREIIALMDAYISGQQ